MTQTIYSLFAFVVMISCIVLVHEWGHYAAGRLFGLIGTKFSLGFGPKLFSKTDRHGTEWRVAPFLLGGYVSFPGDDPENPPADGVKTLNSLKRWQRAVVVGAGPGINLVMAAALLAVIAGFWGFPVGRPIVQTVQANSAAATAGMQAGDRIRSIDGNKVVVANDVGANVLLHPGERMNIGFSRGDREMSADVTIGTTTFVDDDGNSAKVGVLGVTLPSSFRKAENPVEAVSQGVSDGAFLVKAQLETLKQVVTGRRSVMEMSGPIRIARMSAKTMSLGLMPFLYLMALISIAVAVMNLLPIPGLDGGHLATYAVEGTLRRDLPEAVSKRIIQAGFAIIACMGIFAITLDIVALS